MLLGASSSRSGNSAEQRLTARKLAPLTRANLTRHNSESGSQNGENPDPIDRCRLLAATVLDKPGLNLHIPAPRVGADDGAKGVPGADEANPSDVGALSGGGAPRGAKEIACVVPDAQVGAAYEALRAQLNLAKSTQPLKRHAHMASSGMWEVMSSVSGAGHVA